MKIKKNNSIPIYQQIVYSIKNDINNGVLKSNDKLISVRSLSRDLDINQNTILKAYEQLTNEGYVEVRQGVGYYVSTDVKKNVFEYQMKCIRQSLELIKTSAEIGDISLDTVCNLLKEVWNEGE